MPEHIWWSMYSKRLSRGQNRYGADVDWGVLNGDAHWRHLANIIEPLVCGGDAALCQITLTARLFYNSANIKFYPQIRSTRVSDHIYASSQSMPVVNVKVAFVLTIFG